MGITINTRNVTTAITPVIVDMATATAATDTDRIVPAMAVTAAGPHTVDTNINQSPGINQNPGTKTRKSWLCKSKQGF
jgi:hypothetical protein